MAGKPSDDTAAGTSVPVLPVARSEGPSPFDPPPPEQRFIEHDELGRGGMGRVFEATDTALDRQVAIKQSLANEPALLARFEREVRITAKLQHPGIVPVLDAGRDAQGRPYYVMRRIEGKPLAEAINSAKSLAARLALVPHVLAAVDACAYAHARGVIHRDIKPWNVLVGPFGDTLLIDWGLARELDGDELPLIDSLQGNRPASSDLTRAGQAYGTPGFMAPEQARGEPLDRRADVYALGATLLHTLTGTRPVDPEGTTSNISTPGLETLPAELPAELAAIVAKAMSTSPTGRYRDAGMLAEDLRRFMTGQLVAAHHYTARELIARWLRRHRIAVGTSAIALAVLAVIAVVAVRRVMAARDDATDATAVAMRRADEVVLEHAQSVLVRDPTQAVALLRTLETKSPDVWRRASAIFDSAFSRGIARGRLVHPGAVFTRLAASPSGSQVASVASEGGVVLHDPALVAPSRRIATIQHAHLVEWLDETRMLVHDGGGNVSLVGVDGTVKLLAEKIRLVIASRGGRAYVITHEARLVELEVGLPVELAPIDNVVSAHRLSNATIYATKEYARYVPDEGDPVELVRAQRPTSIVVTADESRFAITFTDLTLEWSLASGKPVEIGRWKFSSLGLLYVAHSLLGQQLNRLVWLRRDGESAVSDGFSGVMNARVADAKCAYASNSNGGLWEICIGAITQITGRSETIGSLVLASGFVVAATPTGRLMSWNLAATRPRRVTMGRVRQPVLFAGNRLYTQIAEVHSVDLATREVNEVGLGSLTCRGTKYGVFSNLGSGGASFALELATGAKVAFGAPDLLVSCSSDDGLVVAEDKKITLRQLATPTVVRHTFDAPFVPIRVHREGEWVVAAGKDGDVARFDVRSGEVTRTNLPDHVTLAIDATGRVVLASLADMKLWAVDGTVTPLAIENAHAVTNTSAGIAVVTAARSVVVIAPDGKLRTHHQGSRFWPSVAGAAPFAVLPGPDSEIVLVDLRDGRIRTFPTEVNQALISADGQQVVGWNDNDAMVWQVPPDRDRDALLRLIDETTNAVIDTVNSRVRFPNN